MPTPVKKTAAARFRTIGRKDGLVDRVVQAIEGQILGGRLTVGTKLPPEREFAERLGVSRTVVREAVRILVTKGLLETRHGIGTMVSAVSRGEIVKRLALLLRICDEPVTLEHLHNVRSILEVENAGSVAESATAADIEDLRLLSVGLWTAIDNPDDFAVRDAEFHRRLAQTSRNPLIVSLLDAVHDLYCRTGHEEGNVKGRVIGEFRKQLESEPGRYEQEMATHVRSLERVADCMEMRDASGARRAMREHLEQSLSFHTRLRTWTDGKQQDAGTGTALRAEGVRR